MGHSSDELYAGLTAAALLQYLAPPRLCFGNFKISLRTSLPALLRPWHSRLPQPCRPLDALRSYPQRKLPNPCLNIKNCRLAQATRNRRHGFTTARHDDPRIRQQPPAPEWTRPFLPSDYKSSLIKMASVGSLWRPASAGPARLSRFGGPPVRARAATLRRMLCGPSLAAKVPRRPSGTCVSLLPLHRSPQPKHIPDNIRQSCPLGPTGPCRALIFA